jgi:hypothetical protein
MKRTAFASALLLAGLASASQAQVAEAPQDLGLQDPAVQQSLSALPPIKNDHVRGAILSYDRAAKAWWIQLRCRLASEEEAKRFPAELADFTGAMRGIFHAEFNATPEEAGKYTETVQMYALEAVSGARFFSCGDTARFFFRRGFDETEKFAAFLKTLGPGSK